jgi:peptidoglycan hydrolase-like protein with peptidoglycan-binding domain
MRRLSAAALTIVLLAGCGDSDGDGDADVDPIEAAQQRVSRAQAALTEAQENFDEASSQFCDDAASYIATVDRYGGVLTQDEATVGAVKAAGADLAAPKGKVASSAGDARAAHDEVVAAEQDLAEAEAALTVAQSGTTGAPTTTTTAAPLVSSATIERVDEAQADLDAAFEGVSDETALSTAGEQVNAAAFALEVAWLRLFADAGCLTDEKQQQAITAVADYTTQLQASLTAGGYYDGEIDGVYGPSTVDAVEQLQSDNGLPVTGLVDRATAAALENAVAQQGGETTAQAIAHTAALQSLLAVAGYWTGPVDGQWSDALSTALKSAQTDLGVPATGVVDGATLGAIQESIERAQEPPATTTKEKTTTTASSAGGPRTTAEPPESTTEPPRSTTTAAK